ncbi:hypothetical protein [Methylosinus sp. PW1]|uniref:hypothetical protein n=1 Tax=Methylosinus sp. PW1 TaxID=107636 RepID=UPI0012EB12D6|nr:hypothetical protein [Methylosinus sp. PW1]
MTHRLSSEQIGQQHRIVRMRKVDSATPEMRALYNEYGTALVGQFIACGVTKPRQIRHLIEATLDEFSPTRGSFAKQGIRTQHER